MSYKIAYLHPKTSYRTPLRSDTLWGQICWAIRMVYDNDTLETLLEQYRQPDSAPEDKIFVSSAFPFVEQSDEVHRFLPHPLMEIPMEAPETMAGKSFTEIRHLLRKKKKVRKRKFISEQAFLYAFAGKEGNIQRVKAPREEVVAMAHNTIDRLRGATLEKDGGGQLFHTNERFLLSEKNTRSGLYILYSGDTEKVEAALRFLSHFGFGGDRSIGKGHFSVVFDDYTYQSPTDANAQVTLSLFNPMEAERQSIERSTSRFLNYRMETRLGKGSLWASNPKKDSVVVFTEGSVFPLEDGPEGNFPGYIVPVGDHPAGHKIWHYGHGFMLNIKIK